MDAHKLFREYINGGFYSLAAANEKFDIGYTILLLVSHLIEKNKCDVVKKPTEAAIWVPLLDEVELLILISNSYCVMMIKEKESEQLIYLSEEEFNSIILKNVWDY